MGTPPSRLVAGKADLWMRLDLWDLHNQCRYGLPAGDKLDGDVIARGTDMRTGPYGFPGMEKMMGLISASR